MVLLAWLLGFLAVFIVLSYNRAALLIHAISFAILIGFSAKFFSPTFAIVAGSILAVLFIPLLVLPLRRRLFSKPLLSFYRGVMPTMSRTEKEAISAGTVTWEGHLFKGNPNWHQLLKLPSARLTVDEQAFLDGPVEELCGMINDWDITHNLIDMPKEMWEFLKTNGFFSLIIPKQYGGKEFSAYAHSQILTKIGGKSVTVGSTVAVPNSLGPAELLLHYGTQEQKNYYLPRLAKGEEIPCFALTSPDAGSDAGAMHDYGIVCWGQIEGIKTLGIKLTFNKRYITLAPVATVIGLAFKLYDPDHLIGDKNDIGITCALIPRHTQGLVIGRRHFPLNTPFMNGPLSGEDVFIPLEWVIGGKERVGKGWVMLMECLAAGRSISLPASALGGSKVLSYAAGAYARIRKQFNTPIGKFEGVQEPLARIGAFSYIMDAARTFAAATIDAGEKPAVASAIVKYHVTEMGRVIANDGMDIHGGKGICLGPKNYIGRGYESIPIAITVEGANILTRSMIIFGQGALRCHPYVLAELEAAKCDNESEALKRFDKAVFKHIGFGISNIVRSLFLGLSGSFFVRAPNNTFKRYFQHATRFSSCFALLTDVCMLVLGGKLKRKESISARLGDILSYLYLLSAVQKFYHDQGEQEEDVTLVRYASLYCLFEIQERFDHILKNFPNRPLAIILRGLIFPLGQGFYRPLDKLNRKISQLLMEPSGARARLSAGAYLTPENNLMGDIQDALLKSIAAEPIEKIIISARKQKKVKGYSLLEQAQSALSQHLINLEQFDLLVQAKEACDKIIAVDDFTSDELLNRNTFQVKNLDTYEDSDGTRG